MNSLTEAIEYCKFENAQLIFCCLLDKQFENIGTQKVIVFIFESLDHKFHLN